MTKVLKVASNLPTAYDLVIADLFSKLKKIKNGGQIKLGDLGVFQKKERTLRSALHRKVYIYYHIGFKASPELKKTLDG